jgi:prevent-host-death family protein
MKIVNVHEAKTQLSRLLQDVEDGEEVVIARNGTPVARLVPHVEERKPREPGWGKGWIEILPGFDEYDEQIARDFGTLD